jgi:MoxR-like ATPase
VLDPKDIIAARDNVRQVYIDERLNATLWTSYLQPFFHRITELDSLKDMIAFGASPRASDQSALAPRAYAFINAADM